MGLWTYEHAVTVLPTFVLMIIIAVVMRKLLINKPFETRMLPVKIIAVIIVIIEIGKQIHSYFIGYDLYHIPLHFCSIFLYVLPLMAFYRGKHQNEVRSFASSAMTALLLGMIVMPDIIYKNTRILTFFTDYLAFHTIFFHNLVIFAFFIVFALDLHKPSGDKKEVAVITLSTSLFVAVSASASHLLNTNFANFLRSTVDFIYELTEELKLLAGETVTTAIYTVTLALLHILLLIVTDYLFLLLCICKEKISSRRKKPLLSRSMTDKT